MKNISNLSLPSGQLSKKKKKGGGTEDHPPKSLRISFNLKFRTANFILNLSF